MTMKKRRLKMGRLKRRPAEQRLLQRMQACILREGEYDEHVWTSPANAILIVEKIRDTLPFPSILTAPEFMRGECQGLSGAAAQSGQRLPLGNRRGKRHTVIFGTVSPFYLVKTYGLDLLCGFPGCSSETEPSAATIAFLYGMRGRRSIFPVVFYLELSNAKVADAIAEVTGARTAMLHSCHTLTREEMQRGKLPLR